MMAAAILLLIIAGALRTRLGKLKLAWLLLKVGNALGEAGRRALDNGRGEKRNA